MTPQQYCQQKAGGSGSSFYYSFLFLEPARRQAITALYAFCREVDDVVDEALHPEVAQVKLAWWRNEIAATFQGHPQHPVARALLPAVRAYQLPEAHFQEIIDGMEMDIAQSRYATFDDLKVYCHRVASVVGLLSATVFGYTEERTLGFARDLGLAFQLTNIIRDVGEDARRNRIYLPLEDLRRFQVEPADIMGAIESDNFRALMEFEFDRARAYYQRAEEQLAEADRRAQIPSLIMAAIYLAVLDEIRSDGFRVLRHKISLPPLRKLWLAWKTLRTEKHRRRERLRAHG